MTIKTNSNNFFQKPVQTSFDFFTSSLPKKPYCTDTLSSGLKIRNASNASHHRYIQPNKPNSKTWLLYDIDRPIGLETISDDLMLPTPTIFVQNPQNNHAHLFYALNNPVHMNASSSIKAQRFAGAIDVAMIRALDADSSYVGLIAKNPTHEDWRTYSFGNLAYDLDYFTDFIDTKSANDCEILDAVGLGRNVALFDKVRYWAYKAIRQGYPKDFEQWYHAVLTRAIGVNIGFEARLPISEVRATAKSVAKFVFKNFNEEAFSAIQSSRQAKSTQAKLILSIDKREQAKELRSKGMKTREIANLIKVNQSTVVRWLNK